MSNTLKEISNQLKKTRDTLSEAITGTNVGTQDNPTNSIAINRARQGRRILTTHNSEQGKRVAAKVVKGAGEIQDHSQSLAAQVRPIYSAILAEASSQEQETLDGNHAQNHDFSPAREAVAAEPTLAEKALRAHEIITGIQDFNSIVRKEALDKTLAAKELRDLQQKYSGSNGPETETDQSSGLSRLAWATLLGMPKAGLQRISINVASAEIEIETNQGNVRTISFEKLEDGTVEADLKLDLPSRIINLFRGFSETKEPISLTNRGVVLFTNILTSEITAASLETNPHQRFKNIRLLVKLLRVIEKEGLEIQPVPSYQDLGLNRAELISNSEEL